MQNYWVSRFGKGNSNTHPFCAGKTTKAMGVTTTGFVEKVKKGINKKDPIK